MISMNWALSSTLSIKSNKRRKERRGEGRKDEWKERRMVGGREEEETTGGKRIDGKLEDMSYWKGMDL